MASTTRPDGLQQLLHRVDTTGESVTAGFPHYGDLALQRAKGLATSFNPTAGVLPLGTEAEEASDAGRGESSIDGVQGAALLVWAVQETGNFSLCEMPVRHARRHIEFCIREDGSVCQSPSIDPQTGHLLRRYTHKGVRDDSTWTRVRAWAMVGYAVMHLWTQEREFLDMAMHTAD
jgi:unsaturated chondroitin disaccharide hydrolase